MPDPTQIKEKPDIFYDCHPPQLSIALVDIDGTLLLHNPSPQPINHHEPRPTYNERITKKLKHYDYVILFTARNTNLFIHSIKNTACNQYPKSCLQQFSLGATCENLKKQYDVTIHAISTPFDSPQYTDSYAGHYQLGQHAKDLLNYELHYYTSESPDLTTLYKANEIQSQPYANKYFQLLNFLLHDLPVLKKRKEEELSEISIDIYDDDPQGIILRALEKVLHDTQAQITLSFRNNDSLTVNLIHVVNGELYPQHSITLTKTSYVTHNRLLTLMLTLQKHYHNELTKRWSYFARFIIFADKLLRPVDTSNPIAYKNSLEGHQKRCRWDFFKRERASSIALHSIHTTVNHHAPVAPP